MNIKILLILSLLISSIHSLKSPRKASLNKRLNYSFKLFYKNQKHIIDITKEGASERIIEVIKDDIINDMLYYAKLYNMINDNEKSYLYIFIYEFFTLIRRNEKNSEILIPLYMSNVMTYILFKTIIINRILHNI